MTLAVERARLKNHPMYGHHGNYLRIDLTSRTAECVPLREDVLRDCIGGVGLGTWIINAEAAATSDPLGTDAVLAFVFSPLVGSPLTTSAKFAVCSKSPLTQRLNDSLSSSHFAIAGKKTGHDAIAITGRSDAPVVLVIEPASVRFEDATGLWGQTTSQTQKQLRKTLGASFRTAVIGPAGEQLVRFATISHDRRHAGRGGSGAVMGSKNLKAIAVRGDVACEFARPHELAAFAKQLSKKSLGTATEKYRELGTVSNLMTFNRLGTLPTRNFTSGTFAHADRLAPENLEVSRERVRSSCAACTIGCEHIFPQDGKAEGVRLEYESLFALGPLCDVSDPATVLEATRLCDEFGMDTISAGATIAFGMECAEKGLMTAPSLRFGNANDLLSTLTQIAAREGIGDTLALGSRAAADHIGQGSAAFAPHVKGLEIPGYEPRALQSMALGFAVGTRGADHNRSGAYQVDFSEKTDRMNPDDASIADVIATENEAALMDSLILCKFLRGVFDDRLDAMSEMLRLTCGWPVSADTLSDTGARIVDMKKRFNIQAGWGPSEDTLPDRFFDQPVPGGASAGAGINREEFARRIRLYNLARGWTSEGLLD